MGNKQPKISLFFFLWLLDMQMQVEEEPNHDRQQTGSETPDHGTKSLFKIVHM